MIVYIIRDKNDRYSYSFNQIDVIYTVYALDELISYYDAMEFIRSVVRYLNENNKINITPNSCIQAKNNFEPDNLVFLSLDDLPIIETDRIEYIEMMRLHKDEIIKSKRIFIMEDDLDHLQKFYYNVWVYISNNDLNLQINEVLLNLKELSLREFIPDIEEVIEAIDKCQCITWLTLPKYDDHKLQKVYERLINCITRERKGLIARSLCFDITKTDDEYRYSTCHELRIHYDHESFRMEEDFLLPVSQPRLFSLDFKIKAFSRQLIKVFTESEI
jgi:hypothetical protein